MIMMVLVCRVGGAVEHAVQVLGCRSGSRTLVRGRALDHSALIVGQLAPATRLAPVAGPSATTLRQELRIVVVMAALLIGGRFRRLVVQEPMMRRNRLRVREVALFNACRSIILLARLLLRIVHHVIVDSTIVAIIEHVLDVL